MCVNAWWPPRQHFTASWQRLTFLRSGQAPSEGRRSSPPLTWSKRHEWWAARNCSHNISNCISYIPEVLSSSDDIYWFYFGFRLADSGRLNGQISAGLVVRHRSCLRTTIHNGWRHKETSGTSAKIRKHKSSVLRFTFQQLCCAVWITCLIRTDQSGDGKQKWDG